MLTVSIEAGITIVSMQAFNPPEETQNRTDYFSKSASKSRFDITYPNPVLSPIDNPNMVYIITELTE